MTTTLRENPENTELNLTALADEVHKLTGLQTPPDFWSKRGHAAASETWENSGIREELEKLKNCDPSSPEARTQAWKILDSTTALDYLDTVLRDISNEGKLDQYKTALDLLVNLFPHFKIPSKIADELADAFSTEFGEMYNLTLSENNIAEIKQLAKKIIDDIILKSNKILPPDAQQTLRPTLKKWSTLTNQNSNELGTLVLQNANRWLDDILIQLFLQRASHCPMIAYLYKERAAGDVPLHGWKNEQIRIKYNSHSTQNRVVQERLAQNPSTSSQDELHRIQVMNKAMIVSRSSENSDQLQFNWRFVFNNMLRYRDLSDPQKADAQRALILLLFREFEMGYSLAPLLCNKNLTPLWNDLVRDFEKLSKQNDVDIPTIKKAIGVLWSTPPDADKKQMPPRLRKFLAPPKIQKNINRQQLPAIGRSIATTKKSVNNAINPKLPGYFFKNFGKNKIQLFPVENATRLVVNIQDQTSKIQIEEIENGVFDFEKIIKNLTASAKNIRADVWFVDTEDAPVSQKKSVRLRMPEPEPVPEKKESLPPLPSDTPADPKLEQREMQNRQQLNLALLLDDTEQNAIVSAVSINEKSLILDPTELPATEGWDLPSDTIFCDLDPFGITHPADVIPDLVGVLDEICRNILESRIPDSPEPDVSKVVPDLPNLEQREKYIEDEILEKSARLKRNFEGNSRRFLMREEAMKKAFQNPYAGLVRAKSVDGKMVIDRVKNFAHELGINLSIQPFDGYGKIGLHADFGNGIDTTAYVHAINLQILVKYSKAAEKIIGPLRSTIKTVLRALVVMLGDETLPENNKVRTDATAAEKKYVDRLDRTTKKLSKSAWDRISKKDGRGIISYDENEYVDRIRYEVSHKNVDPNTEIILRNSRMMFPGKSEFPKPEFLKLENEEEEKNEDNPRTITLPKQTDDQDILWEKNKKFLANERNRKYLINRIRDAAHEKMNGTPRSHLLTNPVIFDILNDILPLIDESWESICDERNNGAFLKHACDGKNWLDFFMNELATEGIFPTPEPTLSKTYEELRVIDTYSKKKK